jgi:fluoride exporter
MKLHADNSGTTLHPTAAASDSKPARQSFLRADDLILYSMVSLGAVIGGVLRALASIAALALIGPGFPWGTFFVNVLGSFVIGFFATLTSPGGRVFASTRQRQFVMTGICGGFTTFSMFSLETFRLAQTGRFTAAALNIALSILGWLGAVWLGHLLALRLDRLKGS